MSNHDRESSRPPNRDTDLARAWHEASDEQPPAHLDASLIAAARKSAPVQGDQRNAVPVRAQPRNWLLRWQPLAAAATVAGLAFVLVQVLPREHDLAPMMQHEASSPSAPAATDNRQAPVAEKSVAQPERAAVPDRAPAQSVVPAPPTQPVSPATTARATDGEATVSADTSVVPREASADRRQAIDPETDGRTATAAAAAPAPAAREQGLGKSAAYDVTAWSEKVAALHASGNVTAAEESLRAFRAADPDADSYLPDSLRDWARTVE